MNYSNMGSQKKNILVIGSNSFLGSCLIRKLKDTSLVTGVFHQSTNLHTQDVSYVSVNELDQLQDNFDVVYLISAYIPTGSEMDQQRLYEVNVGLTEKIVCKFKSARIVFASSVSVYGEPGLIIDEKSPSCNVNPYGLSKLWAETIIKQHPSFSIHRISSMYGTHMKKSTFLPAIIKNALEKKEIVLKGNGSRKQNYINVEDVADSLICSATKSANGVFLSVGKQSFSNKEIAEIIKNQLPDTQIVFQGTDDSISYIYNPEYTYKNLDWNCSIEMEAGIKQLITWIKSGF